jgi:anaerobic selenocysteine-containing dehydrogenase
VRLPLRHPRALVDGQVRYIDGNPDHPLNQGVICAKGSSGIMKQYSPARLTKPLQAQAGQRARRRRVRGDLLGEAFAILPSAWRRSAPPTRRNSPCSPAATRCRR